MVSFTNHSNAISIDRLPSKTKIGKDSRYIKNTHYVSPSSPQVQRLFFSLLKMQKITTLQHVTGGNTPNVVLKTMLRYFLKISPLEKILQF